MVKFFESLNQSNDIMNYLGIIKSIFRNVEKELIIKLSIYYKEIDGYLYSRSVNYKTVDCGGRDGSFNGTHFYAPCGYFSISASHDDINKDFTKSVYIDKCIDKLYDIGINFELKKKVDRELISLALKLDSPIRKNLSISLDEIEDLLIDYRDRSDVIDVYFTHDDTTYDRENVALWRIVSKEKIDYFIKSIESRGLEFYSYIKRNLHIVDIVC